MLRSVKRLSLCLTFSRILFSITWRKKKKRDHIPVALFLFSYLFIMCFHTWHSAPLPLLLSTCLLWYWKVAMLRDFLPSCWQQTKKCVVVRFCVCERMCKCLTHSGKDTFFSISHVSKDDDSSPGMREKRRQVDRFCSSFSSADIPSKMKGRRGREMRYEREEDSKTWPSGSFTLTLLLFAGKERDQSRQRWIHACVSFSSVVHKSPHLWQDKNTSLLVKSRTWESFFNSFLPKWVYDSLFLQERTILNHIHRNLSSSVSSHLIIQRDMKSSCYFHFLLDSSKREPHFSSPVTTPSSVSSFSNDSSQM